MTQYQLCAKSGAPKSSIGTIINCVYNSVKRRVIHKIRQGLEINLSGFFIDETNLAP